MDMDDKLKGMLDVDVSGIAARGRKSGNRRKILLALAAVLLVAAGVLGYWGLKAKNYAAAISAADSGDYEAAYSAFTALGNYRDSAENAEKVETAQTFVNSEMYDAQLEVFQLMQDTMQQDDAGTVEVLFEWKTSSLVARVVTESLSVADVENPDAQDARQLAAFLNVCRSADTLSGAMQDACTADGFSVNCRFDSVGNDGELEYSSENGAAVFSCIDVDAAEETVYGQCYQEMVDAVNAQDYSKCLNIWNNFNASDFYSLRYKDLSDYYYYAEGMAHCQSAEEVKLSDVLESFGQVSAGFRDVDAMVAGLEEQRKAVDGTYQNPSTYKLSISKGYAEVIAPYRSLYDYSGTGDYLLRNGKIEKFQVSLTAFMNRCDVEITFQDGSIFVQCTRPPEEEMRVDGITWWYYASDVEHDLSGSCTRVS